MTQMGRTLSAASAASAEAGEHEQKPTRNYKEDFFGFGRIFKTKPRGGSFFLSCNFE